MLYSVINKVHPENKFQSRPEGMRMRSSREGAHGDNAVQFQSCDGCSYCTVLGKNGCNHIVSRQLRDSSMVRRWCGQFMKAETMCTSKTIVADRLWWRQNWWKVWRKQFAETALHNFGTLWSIPDVSLTSARKRLPMAGKRFHNDATRRTFRYRRQWLHDSMRWR